MLITHQKHKFDGEVYAWIVGVENLQNGLRRVRDGKWVMGRG